jgi:hypothetical protein
MKHTIKTMRACLIFLPPPGGEVVAECLDEIESLQQQLAASEAREQNYREEVVKLSYDLANAYGEREAAVQGQADLKEQLAKEWQLHDDTKRKLAAKDVLLRQAYEVLETIDKVAKESKNIISVAGHVMRILGKVRALMVAINKELK